MGNEKNWLHMLLATWIAPLSNNRREQVRTGYVWLHALAGDIQVNNCQTLSNNSMKEVAYISRRNGIEWQLHVRSMYVNVMFLNIKTYSILWSMYRNVIQDHSMSVCEKPLVNAGGMDTMYCSPNSPIDGTTAAAGTVETCLNIINHSIKLLPSQLTNALLSNNRGL